MQVEDFLCDFCGRAWDGAFPLVEGHKGSLICGSCLTVAYAEVVRANTGSAEPGYVCTLCLEHRDDPGWQSPVRDVAAVCARCLRQAGAKLEKDPDWGWTRPA
jgi:hypothetical protein